MPNLHVFEKVEAGRVVGQFKGTLDWGRKQGLRLVTALESEARGAEAVFQRLVRAKDSGEKVAAADLDKAKAAAEAARKAADSETKPSA